MPLGKISIFCPECFRTGHSRLFETISRRLQRLKAYRGMFEQFILAEDRLDTYDKFWQVWTLFFGKIVALCKDGDGYWYVGRIIKSYLFAQSPWEETATDWHTFKDSNSWFFAEIAKNIGHCPSTFVCAGQIVE